MNSIKAIIIILLFLIVIFFSLIGRCFYIQHIRHEHYKQASIRPQEALIIQHPQRGVILDRKGRLLAGSNQIRNIFAEPRIIHDPKELSVQLQPVLNIGAHEICQMITEANNPGYVPLLKDATFQQCEAVRQYYGIGVQTDWKRFYPAGPLAAHVVGFTSSDGIGLSGIELKYNYQLSGSPGRHYYYADKFRRPIKPKYLDSELKNGTSLILTIDSAIQQFAREELHKQFVRFQAESAIAIVANPKSGEILAMVSLPDFDPGRITNEDLQSLRNRAITDQFEPGSIIKPVVAAIAVDAGAVSKTEKIYCEDGIYAGRGFGRIREYDFKRYGNLDPKEIMIHSSNIGMAKMGQKMGAETLYDGLRLFGFGRNTGLDLPGEVSGLLWPTNRWTGYSVTRIPFGQEITVSAMQIVKSYCILANGGRMVRPYLVKAVIDSNGEVININRPAPPVGHIIKSEVANWMIQDVLAATVNEGTGRRAKLDHWQVFGKTGTANIALPDRRGYSSTDYVASFVAGAPADDPEIVVLVSVRKPNRSLGLGYTGGAVASPVAAGIIQQTLEYLGVEKRSDEN